MSAEKRVNAGSGSYAIVEMLEGATDAELMEDSVLMQDVRGNLPLVGVGELVSQLREAESVTSGLMQMGSALSPATYCILTCAHSRTQRALEVAEAPGSRA